MFFELINAVTGSTFRTVDIEFTASGDGEIIVYYLLLPPGSPAPSAQQIMCFSDGGVLSNGSAAKGVFRVAVTDEPFQYSMALSGKEGCCCSPSFYTGIIDGYAYDLYLYAVSASGADNGILTTGNRVLGMPFDSGLGTVASPFMIRQLSPSEFLLYPDLAAANPLNTRGADDSARMLINIGRLRYLYECSGGVHGMENSMELYYLLNSPVNLCGYPVWSPIGACVIPPFSGNFGGNGQCTPISGLSVTVSESFGLFERADSAVFHDLTFECCAITVIPLNRCPSRKTRGAGLLAASARNTIFRNISVNRVKIRARNNTAVGCMTGIASGSCSADNINLSHSVLKSAPFAGGIFGKCDGADSGTLIENCLCRINITGTFTGGAIGELSGLCQIINCRSVVNISSNGCGGGLIGRIIGGKISVSGCNTGGALNGGSNIGGIAGLITETDAAFDACNSDARLCGLDGVGGICGTCTNLFNLTVSSCSSFGQIEGVCGAGGITGRCGRNSYISGCFSSAELICRSDAAGGITGFMRGSKIDGCFYGDFCRGSAAVGGIVGRCSDGIVSNCYSNGTVSGVSGVGGVIGVLESGLCENCNSSAAVEGCSCIGRIIGARCAAMWRRNP